MATNEVGGKGRQLSYQVTHFLRKSFTYEDTTGVVGILPAGAIVLRGAVYIHTGFNDTNGDDLDVGIEGGDDDLFASGVDMNSAAVTAFDDLAAANQYSASERVVTYNLTTAASGDGTAGSATIYLEYLPDNDG